MRHGVTTSASQSGHLGAARHATKTWRAAVAVQRHLCRGYDAVLAMSEQDARALAGVHRGLPVTVLPFPVVDDGPGGFCQPENTFPG